MTLSVKKWLLCYAVAAVVYAAADVAWIATVAGNLYQSQIGHLLAPAFNIPGCADVRSLPPIAGASRGRPFARPRSAMSRSQGVSDP